MSAQCLFLVLFIIGKLFDTDVTDYAGIEMHNLQATVKQCSHGAKDYGAKDYGAKDWPICQGSYQHLLHCPFTSEFNSLQ